MLTAGTRLGPYEIVSAIGAGGMGEVYQAHDTKLGRDVAIKVLPEAFAHDPQRLSRFQREAKLLASLNHPNVATIHGLEESNGTHYLVMELVPGETLWERVAREGALPVEEALKIAVQIAEALEAAHEKSIVHRDLKPANVKVTPEGKVKVLDFGLAKAFAGEESGSDPSNSPTLSQAATLPGVILGTAAYMSPEQARGKTVDKRTDIWAFGCLFYELLTGRRAFHGEVFSDTIAAVLDKEPDWQGLPPETPAKIRDLLWRCLQKDVQRRLRDVGDARIEIDEARMTLAALEPSRAAATAPAVARMSAWRRPAAWTVAFIVVGLLAALFGLDVGGWRDQLLSRKRFPRISSLAVLPLENFSHDPDQEYFADGMTDALITDLAQISALRVISRTSVMRYKRTQKAVPEIATDLHVDAIVEGSVERAGDRVRITAQLIRGDNDQHLWAKAYERDLVDVLALQDELARSIAGEIQVSLTPAEHLRLNTARPVDPEAYQLYLKGRYLWDQRTEQSVNEAIRYFEQALQKAPSYASAYSGLADSYSLFGTSFDVGSLAPNAVFPKAEDAAKKALQLDDSLAEAHTSLAFVELVYDWDWSASEREFKRALEINNGYANAHHWYAHQLIAVGHPDEALAESEKALDLDQLNPIINTHLGWHYVMARQYDNAIEQLLKTLELFPNSPLAHWYLGWAYEQKGMYGQALSEYGKTKDLLKGNSAVIADIGHAYAVSGNLREARRIIDELKALSNRMYVSAYEVALIYTGLGDRSQAFDWLGKAYKDRSDWLVYLRSDPRLDPLRSDPRFTDLLRRMNLQP